ncbi:MAG: TfoX/Sxy family protein [Chloroflexota bacterium]|nr:TfoX/Sxy family protein [Chloroflexota bacterium]MDE2940912.1 TfoX/Sxy family protein [Chloroflexota bacterium]MDE3268387.1 TfoX/Sxy family protein [Chloroflexota bacterium]
MTNDPSVQSDLDAMLIPWGDVSTRRMFGGLGYFVGDRLFAVYHRGEVATKLPEPDRTQALESGRAALFSPTLGRRFGDWVSFPVDEDGGVDALLPWLKTAIEYVRVTPPSGRKTSGRSQ